MKNRSYPIKMKLSYMRRAFIENGMSVVFFGISGGGETEGDENIKY